MKSILLFAFLFTISTFFAQDKSSAADSHFGVSVNSSMRFQLVNLALTPSGFYYKNGHQINLGLVIQPFNFKYRKNFGADFIYKFFPNGLDNRIDFYFAANLNYLASIYTGSYTSNRHFFAATFGYGFQKKISKRLYFGTDFGVGVITNSESSSDNYFSYSYPMFNYFDFEGVVNLNVGYRFK